ncbi:MAG: response regulator transcription factor [Chloroflexota bacterium]
MDERVLVVDDDDLGRRTLAEILMLEGFEVVEADGGRAAMERLGEGVFDVVLLDLKMPDVDGLAVLDGASRLSPDTQVIVFTAHGSLESAIQAVRHGAFDYLLKPVSSREILACVRRAVDKRRQQVRRQRLLVHLEQALRELRRTEAPGEAPMLELGELRLDVSRRRLERGEQAIELTPAELRLFLALYRHRGRVVRFTELVDQVQGYQVEAWEAPAMVRPVVSRLREKLRRVGASPECIETVRGSGYLLAEV